MIKRMRTTLVPFALHAMALAALVFTGCCREEEKPSTPPPATQTHVDPPAVYMKDPAFRQALDKQLASRNEIQHAHEKLMRELESRIDAQRAAMPGADDATVKAALEKDPAWNALVKKIEDTITAIDDNRKATTKIVSERIRRPSSTRL